MSNENLISFGEITLLRVAERGVVQCFFGMKPVFSPSGSCGHHFSGGYDLCIRPFSRITPNTNTLQKHGQDHRGKEEKTWSGDRKTEIKNEELKMKSKIAVAGTGYVGLSLAVLLAQKNLFVA